MSKIPYTQTFNRDDIFLRSLLVGALASLNRYFMWENVFDNDEKVQVSVPFYFSTTGDERFLKDTFMNGIDSDANGCVAETFYNIIPRGIVNMEDISINEDELTNKFSRGYHTEETESGELRTYSSDFFNIPITMNLSITGYVDSHTDMLKFTESLIRIFYKNISYNIEYKNMRCPCVLEFPADYTQERLIDFGFSDRKEWKVTFNLIIKSIMPIPREGSKIFAGNRMDSFPCNIFIGSSGQAQVTTTNGEIIILVLDEKGNLVPLDPNLSN